MAALAQRTGQMKLALTRSRTKNAVRLRRRNERIRAGLALYEVLQSEVDVEALLEAEGLLDPLQDHKHAEIQRALNVWIKQILDMHFHPVSEDVI
jgi:hypothetical protein